MREFRETDYDDLFEYLSQLEDNEFEGYPGITYENGREHLKYRMGLEEFYAIELKESGKVIGNIYCGNRVFAECDPRNDCSWKLLEKAGLKREAHFKQNVYFHKDENGMPKWKDTYVYARLNEQ